MLTEFGSLNSFFAGKSVSAAMATSGHVPRLKDVAEAAGVSLSAASRILRGEVDRFGPETCDRVHAAAQKLGWRRNLLVSGMQTGRTKTVGVVIPPFDSFWVDVLSGVHSELATADYLPITIWVGDLHQMPHFEMDEAEGLKKISRLLDRRVDALILWPSVGAAYYGHFRELVERNVPVAVIDHEYSEDRIADSIETDEEESAAPSPSICSPLAIGGSRVFRAAKSPAKAGPFGGASSSSAR